MVNILNFVFLVEIKLFLTLIGNATKEFKQPTVPSSDNNELKPPEVVLRRTQSFESDEKLVVLQSFIYIYSSVDYF